MIREQYDHLMKRGAVLVDDTDPGMELEDLLKEDWQRNDLCRVESPPAARG